jgi:hypothetical protein
VARIVQVPTETIVTVFPEIVHTDVVNEVFVIDKPDVEVSETEKVESP